MDGAYPLRIFWIDAPAPGRIAVMPRPHPESFPALRQAGVDVCVSLLEPAEADHLGLGDEAGLCSAAGIEFHDLAVPDHGVPATLEPVVSLSGVVDAYLTAGRSVAVHCYAGLGRSPLLVAAVLIDRGLSAIDACDRISRARGRKVPEMREQLDWLLDYERLRRGWT